MLVNGGDFLSSSPQGKNTVAKAYEIQLSTQRSKKKDNRRFNDNQIRSLESMFKMDTKLEPKRKLQLARELELQPRQVAIWFQNRRARSKSKQLEQEYLLLKHNYDNLNSRYKSLWEEKQTLHAQLQKLINMPKETDEDEHVSKSLEGRSKDRGFENKDTNVELHENTTSMSNTLENGRTIELDNEESKNIGYINQNEKPQLLDTN